MVPPLWVAARSSMLPLLHPTGGTRAGTSRWVQKLLRSVIDQPSAGGTANQCAAREPTVASAGSRKVSGASGRSAASARQRNAALAAAQQHARHAAQLLAQLPRRRAALDRRVTPQVSAQS